MKLTLLIYLPLFLLANRAFALTISEAEWLLELKPGYTQDDVKKAHRKFLHQLHPDQNHGDKAAEDKLKYINRAKEVLSGKEKPSLQPELDIAPKSFIRPTGTGRPSSQPPPPHQRGQDDIRRDMNTSQMREEVRVAARKFARAPVNGGEGLGLAEAEAENFASIWANSPGKNGPIRDEFAKYRARFKQLMEWALDTSETGGRKSAEEAAEYANNYARLKAFTLDDAMLEEYLREMRRFSRQSFRQPTIQEITERAYKYAKTPFEKGGLGYSAAKAQDFASYWQTSPPNIQGSLAANYDRYEEAMKHLVDWAITPKGQDGGGKLFKDLKQSLPDWQFNLFMAQSTGDLDAAVEREKYKLRPDWPGGCGPAYAKFRR